MTLIIESAYSATSVGCVDGAEMNMRDHDSMIWYLDSAHHGREFTLDAQVFVNRCCSDELSLQMRPLNMTVKRVLP